MSGPSELLISVLLPASAADLRSAGDVRRADRRSYAELIEGCMAEAGFDLSYDSPRPADATPRYGDFPDLEAIRTYGLSIDSKIALSEAELLQSQSFDGEAPAGSDYTQAEFTALLGASMECERHVEAERPLEAFLEEHEALVAAWYERFRSEEVDGSPEVTAVTDEFPGCVSGNGWDFVEVVSEQQFLAAATGELSHTDPDKRAAVAERAAEIYVACMEPVLAVRTPLRMAAREQFVEENFAAMVEAERRFREVLAELGL